MKLRNVKLRKSGVCLFSHRAQSRLSAIFSDSVMETFTSTHTPNGIRTRNFSGGILGVCQTALLERFIIYLFIIQCPSWTATHQNGAPVDTKKFKASLLKTSLK
jgi:hypothetical protein